MFHNKNIVDMPMLKISEVQDICIAEVERLHRLGYVYDSNWTRKNFKVASVSEERTKDGQKRSYKVKWDDLLTNVVVYQIEKNGRIEVDIEIWEWK